MDVSLAANVELRTFSNQEELNWMVNTFRAELAEPYSIYTYNYFLSNWPELTIIAYYEGNIIGCIMGSYDTINPKKAYIGMLVVSKEYRRLKIGLKLFQDFYQRVKDKVNKIVLETECINQAALNFYLKLGFFKTRRMNNYYLSGNDAFRLKLVIVQNSNLSANDVQQPGIKIQQQASKVQQLEQIKQNCVISNSEPIQKSQQCSIQKPIQQASQKIKYPPTSQQSPSQKQVSSPLPEQLKQECLQANKQNPTDAQQ